MIRGEKVRKVKKNKRAAIHKMVEALISGNTDAATAELHKYLQLKTRDLILGESDDESEEKEEKKDKKGGMFKKKDKDEDGESDEDEHEDESDEDDKDEKKEKKEKLKESAKGNFLKDKPHKSNDTKAKSGLKKIAGSKDGGVEAGKIKGNVFKNKPKTSNDTKAKKGLGKISGSKDGGVQKDKITKKTDGRDYDMGTGNV